jgi:hypothetical protein
VLAEATALPSEDGLGRDDHQRLAPAGPGNGQAGPEQAVSRAELWAGQRSPGHGKLLAKGQVLQGELTVVADEERQESKQVEQESDHEPRV